MARFNEEWRVQPHGKLEKIDDGLFTVAGDITMPLGNFPRRMTVVVLDDCRVAVWSPIALDEAEMRKLEALGEIAFLIVPGVAHRLDIKPWKARYPMAHVLCPPGARMAVEEAVPVAGGPECIPGDSVTMETVPGVEEKEAALVVRRGGRASLVVNDILANVRHPHGIGAHIMARLFGFGTDRPKMPWLGKRKFVKDRKALADAFRRWAREPGLTRIIVSHGDIISSDPRGVLQRVASDLGT